MEIPREIAIEIVQQGRTLKQQFMLHYCLGISRKHIEILRKLRKGIDKVSEKGEIEVLEYWKKSRLILNKKRREKEGDYTGNAITYAKDERTLDWWLKSCGELKIRLNLRQAIMQASKEGEIDKLEWYIRNIIQKDGKKKRELQNQIVNEAIGVAKDVKTLEWWNEQRKENRLKWIQNHQTIIRASIEGKQKENLDWIEKNLIGRGNYRERRHSGYIATLYAKNVQVLEWIRESKIGLKIWMTDFMIEASQRGIQKKIFRNAKKKRQCRGRVERWFATTYSSIQKNKEKKKKKKTANNAKRKYKEKLVWSCLEECVNIYKNIVKCINKWMQNIIQQIRVHR